VTFKKVKEKLMSSPIFSIREALVFGWKIVKRETPYFLRLFLLLGFVYGIQDLISEKINLLETQPNLYYLILVINGVFSIVVVKKAIHMGILKSSIKMNRQHHGRLNDMVKTLPKLVKYIIADTLYASVLWMGMILLFFPGAIWAMKYGFINYLIIDTDMSIRQTFKKSAEMTRGTKWHLFLFGLLLIFMIIGSVAPYFLGLRYFFGSWYNVFQLHAWQRLVLAPLGLGFLVAYPLAIAGKGYVYQQYYNKFVK